MLGPLFFLVYITDLVDDLSSDAKLFSDDTSLFTIVYDENITAEQLNNDLKIISEWAYRWKMQFNPDKTKQAVKVIFSPKRINPTHPPLYFDESQVVIKQEQKHLDFEFWCNFPQPPEIKCYQCKKGYWCIRFLSKHVTRDVLDQMYKLYVRPHLNYGGFIYHNLNQSLLWNSLENLNLLNTLQHLL